MGQSPAWARRPCKTSLVGISLENLSEGGYYAGWPQTGHWKDLARGFKTGGGAPELLTVHLNPHLPFPRDLK